jgi:hypothetical protein
MTPEMSDCAFKSTIFQVYNHSVLHVCEYLKYNRPSVPSEQFDTRELIVATDDLYQKIAQYFLVCVLNMVMVEILILIIKYIHKTLACCIIMPQTNLKSTIQHTNWTSLTL